MTSNSNSNMSSEGVSRTMEATGSVSVSHSIGASDQSATKNEVTSNVLQKDNRAVSRSRALVFVVLATAAAVLAYLTYFYVHMEQREDFENEFANLADEIMDISQQNVKKVFGTLEGLSVAATSHALHNNESFPFVTIPNYPVKGATARASSQALIIAYLPLVSEENRRDWEQYSVDNQDWIQDSYPKDVQVQPILQQIHAYGPKEPKPPQENRSRRRHLSSASCSDEGRRMLKERITEPEGSGPYAPVWQMTPTPPANDTATLNYNLFDKPVYEKGVNFIAYSRKPVFLDVCNQAAWFGGHYSNKDVLQTAVVQPVFESFEEDAPIVGTFVAIIPWKTFFDNIVHARAPEVRVVLSNTCNEVFTFSIQGHNAVFLDEEDLHDPTYDSMAQQSPFAEFANPKELLEADLGEHCVYNVHVYPTKDLEDSHLTNDPIWYCLLVLAVFSFTSIIFLLYDMLVQRRQMRLVEDSARKHEQIVSSLFPEMVRDRVFDANQEMERLQSIHQHKNYTHSYSDTHFDMEEILQETKPIADLYPAATVMFADMAGFTAWSSIRQPGDVFKLLELVYHSFDSSARMYNVFKVETVGDSYVAVAGVPEARIDHAVVMARFSRNCMERFGRIIKKLETRLGPDTATLKLRIGLHSGPVTGGVLRNSKSRFQLFGDTVNTASRMETTGLPGKIQVSRETADLLIAGGKECFLEPGSDLVDCKGKGSLQTHFLKVKRRTHYDQEGSMSGETNHSMSGEESGPFRFQDETQKLVEWNCSMLIPHLKAILARRQVTKPTRSKDLSTVEKDLSEKYMVLGEVKEIIDLPSFVPGMPEIDPSSVRLDQEVVDQLRRYIMVLSQLYQDNPFHSFNHASHVTMSTTKLLARISNGSSDDPQTFGICDPLTQFSIVLSALLHDADHGGIPNPTLIKENPTLASAYKNKSVAEQNSIDLAFSALMQPQFDALRKCIYCNEAELRRFRTIIVNSVMATDIFDPELSSLRKNRWNRVFEDNTSSCSDSDSSRGVSMTEEGINRKATLVLEHLIQASDVSHCMQHWFIYVDWNSKLFEEMYRAYRKGRTNTDPSTGWYKGEIWFFDNYVIPLAKKLKDCGVFGVSSDEYLNYAVKNRREWEVHGEEIVAGLVAKFSSIEMSPDDDVAGEEEEPKDDGFASVIEV
ncbi:Receptor-type guanylate cyclase gcy [Seminavis robusta]|uniref:Receptor-type guanylate cyclase gcy n=1 Tax=Seminavis robusta TaxID=568900 RepID=A0A9N8DAH6_9STRA|nr:Receptor-type guanylate cyclase gcy [Seminavis robusta]|eukprot:Sro34_g022090.1 Receptor-type guanylate cyclase gcy (1159) ;mRNA; f:127779-132036